MSPLSFTSISITSSTFQIIIINASRSFFYLSLQLPKTPTDIKSIITHRNSGSSRRAESRSIDVILKSNIFIIVSFVTTDKIRIANLACEDVVALGRAPYTNWIAINFRN